MAGAKISPAMARDARELAATPVPNPYRGQLTDPFSGRPTTARLDPAPESAHLPAGPGRQTRAPRAAVIAGVFGVTLGSVVGLFGLMLLAVLSFQSQLGAPDRSFHRGSDASYTVLALLDFGLAALAIAGGSAMLSGRLAGRLALTAAGWAMLGLSFFWWHSSDVRDVVPIVIGIATAIMLVAMYDRGVTRWLGVLAPVQPE
jgi:hypothetical protein